VTDADHLDDLIAAGDHHGADLHHDDGLDHDLAVLDLTTMTSPG
jgi:hypothetical protein